MPSEGPIRTHPTALISAEADLGEDVQVGPYVVIEGPVIIGAGCVLRPFAHLIGPLTLGRNNQVFSGAVIGEQPQHVKYKGELTRTEIGDNNIFRENVTVHRGTTATGVTRIGSNNFLMAGAHVAHDCVVGNNCILANGALMGGHCILEDNVFLSGNCAIHQFVRVGRLALLSGVSAATKDIPPFIMEQRVNVVVGVNVVGMRRAGIPHAHIDAVRQAFHHLYREELTVPAALARIEEQFPDVPEVMELVTFIRKSSRGISTNLCRDAA
jgi:UDP-N-acetylglucosamine acyltransferase